MWFAHMFTNIGHLMNWEKHHGFKSTAAKFETPLKETLSVRLLSGNRIQPGWVYRRAGFPQHWRWAWNKHPRPGGRGDS